MCSCSVRSTEFVEACIAPNSLMRLTQASFRLASFHVSNTSLFTHRIFRTLRNFIRMADIIESQGLCVIFIFHFHLRYEAFRVRNTEKEAKTRRKKFCNPMRYLHARSLAVCSQNEVVDFINTRLVVLYSGEGIRFSRSRRISGEGC